MSAIADTLLDELVSRPKAAAPPARGTGSFSEFNVSPETQRGRDDERVKILRSELAQETDPKLRADIQLEIDRTGGGSAYGKPRADASQPSTPPAGKSAFGDVLGDLVSGKSASKAEPRAPPTEISTVPGETPVRETPAAPERGIMAQVLDNAVAGPEAGLGIVTSIPAAVVGNVAGAIRRFTSDAPTPEARMREGAMRAAEVSGNLTYQPRSERGGELLGTIGDFLQQSGIQGLNPAGVAGPAVRATAPRPAPKLIGSGSIADQAVAPAIAAPEAAVNLDIPTYLRRQREQPAPATQAPAAVPARQPLTLAPEEAKKPVGPSIFDRPEATPAQTAAAAVEQAPKFEEAPSPIERTAAAPKPEQATRAKVLQEVGLTGQGEARKSAIEGNPAKARTDWDASRMEGDAGEKMQAVFANERSKLTQYAEKIVDDTGGTRGADSITTEKRGHTILAPLEGARDLLKQQENELYRVTRERLGDTPVALDGFSKALDTNSKFASQESQALRKGVRSLMKEMGVADKNGKPGAMTVKQAEDVRKYLNANWRHENKGVIGELKGIIDEDVTRHAGADVFEAARKLHQQRAKIFDDPKGMASLLDADGPDGINRAIPYEKIANKITAMPIAQQAHIVKTLQNVPEALRPSADAALAEIRGNFANRVLEIGNKTEGQWNAPGVTKFLNDNKAQARLLFDDAQMKRFQNLNDAGHILRIGPYPGAAVQGSNLVRSGVTKGIEAAASSTGALLGTLIGGPVGTAVGAAGGGMVGRAAAGKASAAMEARAVKNRITTLGEVAKGPAGQ